jgi:ankyrin repeat protein
VIIEGRDVREYMGQRLWFACQAGYVKAVTLLITLGADVNFRYDAFYKTTPLMIAIVEEKPQVVPLLIEAGAEVNIEDELGRTALMDAAAKDEPETVSLLLTAGANTDDGNTALLIAVKCISLLVKAGANTNLQNKEGDTALMKAAWMGRTEDVSMLVKAGAALDLQNKRGDSALILATTRQHILTVKELFRAGADLNLQNEEELTALMISTISGVTDITKTLLSGENIAIDIQTKNGWSALFFAADEGNVATTKLLLKARADPLLRDNSGLTAVDVASAGENDDVYGLLRNHMRTTNTLQSRVSQGIRDLVTNARHSAKQAFIRLETRVVRYDKMKQESGVRGEEEVRRKLRPHPPPLPPALESRDDEYWSSLAPP